MKLKKVLSGFVSAAILATTMAIVMPMSASAEDTINLFSGSVTFDTNWGTYENVTGYADAKAGDVIKITCSEVGSESYHQVILKDSSWSDFEAGGLDAKADSPSLFILSENDAAAMQGGFIIGGYDSTITSVDYLPISATNEAWSGTVTFDTNWGTYENVTGYADAKAGDVIKITCSEVGSESYHQVILKDSSWSDFEAGGLDAKADSPSLFILSENDAAAMQDGFIIGGYDCTISKIEILSVGNAEVAVDSVTLDEATLALKKGEEAQLAATVEPAEADQGITWTTSNNKVATVTADGKVTAVASGTATITATSTADETKTAECEVTVTNLATAIAIDETAFVLVGETKTLSVTTTPADADELNYTWTSSDTSVATVANGVVTGVAAGEADITVKAGTLTATCTVTVTDEAIPATDVTLNKTTLTLEVEGSETLTATITPEDSTDSVTWTTSNADVATVVNGKVTAVAEGTATITATAGNQTATCAVTVTKPEEPDEPEGIVIWSGSTALGSWANTVEINKTKFADVKAGDILRVEVADLESNAQICIKTMADGWPAIPSFLDVNEWGCIDVTKAGTYDYELTAADAAALKANNTILSGQFLTYKSLTLIVSEDAAEPSEYETGKVEAVTEYAAPTGTELYVMSITPDEAKTYNAYNVTVTVGDKSKTFEVTKCYGGFAFKDSQGNTQKIEAADGYFIVVKVTGLTGDQTAVVTMAPVKE